MMCTRTILALVVCVSLASCANPKYADPNNQTGLITNGGQDQKTPTCLSKFSSGKCLSLVWEKVPTEEDYGSFLFKTFRPNLADGSPVLEDLSGDLAVVLWMPSMGHGSSPVSVERLDVGTYRASKVFFTMRGEWEIRFQLKSENDVKDQAIISINF